VALVASAVVVVVPWAQPEPVPVVLVVVRLCLFSIEVNYVR
jgi:hypothetical protein